MESKYFFITQRSYKDKNGVAKLLTLLVDGKGNPVVTTSVDEVPSSKHPDLPEVKVTLVAGSSFNGRVTSRVTGIEFV